MAAAVSDTIPKNAGQFWSGPMLRIGVDGPGADWEVVSERPFVRVGSHPRAEVRLSPVVAPPVCLYVQTSVEGCYALAVAPTRGGAPIYSGPLRSGKRLKVGPYRLRFEFESNEPPLGEPASLNHSLRMLHRSSSLDEPGPVLQIRRDQGVSEKAVLIRRALTLVGRGGESTLRLRLPSVSRPHCLLYWHAGNLWFVDMLSRAGTRWEGQSLDCGILAPGSMLQLGEVILNVAEPSSSVLLGAGASQIRLMESASDGLGDGSESDAFLDSDSEMEVATTDITDETCVENGSSSPPPVACPAAPECDSTSPSDASSAAASAPSSLEKEKQELQTRLAELTEFVARQQAEFASVQQRLSQMEAQQQQVQRLESQIAATMDHFQSVAEDRDAAKQTIAEMADELARLKAALEAQAGIEDDDTDLEDEAGMAEDGLDEPFCGIALVESDPDTGSSDQADEELIVQSEDSENGILHESGSEPSMIPADDGFSLRDAAPEATRFAADEDEEEAEAEGPSKVNMDANDPLSESSPGSEPSRGSTEGGDEPARSKKLLDLEDFVARQKKKKRRWWGGG